MLPPHCQDLPLSTPNPRLVPYLLGERRVSLTVVVWLNSFLRKKLILPPSLHWVQRYCYTHPHTKRAHILCMKCCCPSRE